MVVQKVRVIYLDLMKLNQCQNADCALSSGSQAVIAGCLPSSFKYDHLLYFCIARILTIMIHVVNSIYQIKQ